MKKTSKIISILLVAIMALSVFAISSSAIATELAAGNTKETATNIPNYGVEYTSALSKAGEQDWFKFTTLSEDAYYTIGLENYSIREDGSSDYWSLNLFVYDMYNKQIAHIHKTSAVNIKLEKNTTYYIKVCVGAGIPNSTGNYAVAVSYKLDPVSNVQGEAMTINVNTTYKYSLDGIGDSDWYKFTAPVDGTYKISLENYNIYQSGSSDYWSLNLFLFDTYNKQLARIYRTSSTEVKLEKGVVYYVGITMGEGQKGSTGNYGFSIKCDGVVTPPDTTKTLSSISISKMPAKTTYTVGESFDMSGLTVKATYSDGSTANVSSYKISGFDSSKAGTSTVTVSYTEGSITRTASFNVTIEEKNDDSSSSTPDITIDFDFMAILTAIWNFFVWLFDLVLGLFA